MDTTGTNKALSGEQQSAPHAGNHAEVTEQLRRLGRELAALEGILARAASDREESLNQWSRQVNLLEQLLHFQHNCLDFSSPGAAADGLFSYLKPLVPYQEAYLILVPGEVSAERRIFATHAKQIPAITVLLDNNGAEKKILEILGDAGACRRFGEGEAPLPAEIQWHFLETRNLLLFPIRIRRKLIGFGLLSSNSLSFLEDHCTAVNLISGSLSAILFQQVFFERIKKRFAGVSPFGQLAEGINLPEAFNGGAMAALLVDRDRRILAGNQRAREQWGTRAEGLSGEPLGSLFGQDSAQNLIEALAEGGGKGPLRPLTLYDRHGAIWDFYPDLRPRGFDNGECLLLGFEVTQWRREEIRRQDENTMRQVVHFSRVMSSYLGDLLTVLTPNVSLLKAQFPKEHELRRHIGFMELSLHQAERVVKQLLNYGLEDIEEPEPLALAELVREWRENLGKDLPENISLKVSGDENLPEVMYFSRRLNRLVRVLVENSAEALPNGGKIAVHLTAKNLPGKDKGKSLLSLVVADNGTGIDPKLRPHIFKPFFSTKVKNEEMGLGLFNAYCIAKDSGGDIQVESEPGKGSVFRITLPAKMVSHLFPETALPAEQAEAAHPAAGETPLPEASGPVVQEAPLPEADQQEVRAEAPESREGERPDISEAPVEAQAGETSDPQRAENTAEPEEAAESSAEAPEEKRVSPLKAEVQHFEEKPVFTDDPQEVHIEEALAAAEVFSKILPEDLEALAEAGIDPVHQAQNRHGILVVDDEFNIRNMLREILEHRGYTVYTASNGREGVEVYQAHATDIGLVIMDMVMPEMSGKDAFHRIKAEETDPKFLVISGFAKPKEVKEVMQNGADDYMKKPFQLDELVERVEKLLKD